MSLVPLLYRNDTESIAAWSDEGSGTSFGGTYRSISTEIATIVNARSVPTLTCTKICKHVGPSNGEEFNNLSAGKFFQTAFLNPPSDLAVRELKVPVSLHLLHNQGPCLHQVCSIFSFHKPFKEKGQLGPITGKGWEGIQKGPFPCALIVQANYCEVVSSIYQHGNFKQIVSEIR